MLNHARPLTLLFQALRQGLAARLTSSLILSGALLAGAAPAVAADWTLQTSATSAFLELIDETTGFPAFTASCSAHDPNVTVMVETTLSEKFGNRDSQASVQVLSGSSIAEITGRFGYRDSTYGNIYGPLPYTHPFFLSLPQNAVLRVNQFDGGMLEFSGIGGLDKAREFVGRCAMVQQQAPAPTPQAAEPAPQAAQAGPQNNAGAQNDAYSSIRGPITGLWRQVSSNYIPCPNCRAMVFATGGTAGQGYVGGFSTDTCISGDLFLNGDLTGMPGANPGVARVRMTADDTARGSVSLQVNGSQMTLTVTPTGDFDDLLTGTIVETYDKVAGADGLTPDVVSSFNNGERQFACSRYPQGQELAMFGRGQPPASPAQAPQANPDDGLSAGEALVLGGLAAGAIILGNEIAEEFFTEAPAPDAPDGDGRRMTVTITSVRANDTTFGFGGDEIFLLFSDGTRVPANGGDAQSIDAGETWSPNARVTTSGGLSVDLREWDSFNASDMIGTITIEPNRDPGRYSATLRGDGAEYVVTYEVERAGRNRQTQQQPQRQPQREPRPEPAPTPDRVWAVHNSYENITATDCSEDCEEDIGIIFMCQGASQPALVSVPWAAIERGQPGSQRDLTIVVDGQASSYVATLGEYGLVGHIPSFTIHPNDPLIGALQAGNRAEIIFEGGTTTIGLRGSRNALDIFKAHCSWNEVAQLPPQQPEPQPFWFVSQFADFNTGRQTTQLTFGLPETDAIGFNASCVAGSNNAMIPVDIIADFGNQPAFAQVPVYIQTASYTSQYQGQVFVDSSEWAGIRTSIPRADPIWSSLQAASGQVIFGMGGGQPSLASSAGAAQAVGQFLAACSAPGAGQPGVQQPGMQRPGVQQPGMQQPGQPQTGGTFSFQCDDGSALAVNLTGVGDVSVAKLTHQGAVYDLIEVPGAVGKKYSNGSATLNIAGPVAQFTAPSVVLFCQAG